MGLIPSNQAKDFMNEIKKYEPNNVLDWNDAKYYNDIKYISNTMLKYINESPEHFDAYMKYPTWRDTKQAYIDGRALHCYILEFEEFNKRFWYVDDQEKCDEIGGKKPRGTKVYKEWKVQLMVENQDKDEISFEWYCDIKCIAEKLKKIPQAAQLLENTKKEIAYWRKLEGFNCKCKVDAINVGNYIVDLKGFKDVPNPYNFRKEVNRYHLDRQAAFYCDIVGVDQFWFINVEKTFPYTVGIYEVSGDTLDAGREKYRHLLNVHRNNLKNYDKEYVNNFCYFGSI